MNLNPDLLYKATHAAIEAGKLIMEVYDKNISVEFKHDRSPLTIADKNAHNKIVFILNETGIPLLSEEGRSIPFEERKFWEQYWLIDPLDGTKEFIKRNGEFTVNIALVKNHTPVLGVIYAPVPDTLYFGSTSTGSYLLHNAIENFNLLHESTSDALITISEKLPLQTKRQTFTIIASRSHNSPETAALIQDLKVNHGTLNFISKGSSLKICLVAEGTADFYPRLAPTMEWDTAAGQAIAINAGCNMVTYPDKKPVTYNKENLLNPYFIVSRNGKDK